MNSLCPGDRDSFVRTLPIFHLRDIAPDDYDAAIALWRSAPGVRTNESREEFERILLRNPGLGCVAEVHGDLIGAVLACHDGHRGHLYHLAVAQKHRHRGIARAMVDRCLERLAALGIRRCSIHLIVDNHEGSAFWERIGWRVRSDLRVMARDI